MIRPRRLKSAVSYVSLVIALGVVCVVLALIVWWIDSRAFDRGFADADRQWAERVAEEKARQEEANKQALEKAQEEIAQLTRSTEERDVEIARLIALAAEDPDADRVALGAASVRRLNSIFE